MDVPSADVLRLIQHHLTECGLHEACRAVREESGVGASGTHSNLRASASSGRWGEVLSSLSQLDRDVHRRVRGLSEEVHEMTVLELGEVGETGLAFATLRACREHHDDDEHDDGGGDRPNGDDGRLFSDRWASSIERRLHALEASRRRSATTTASSLPADYYGENRVSRQRRRDALGKRLEEAIPRAPVGRLTTLLQQAVKWQAHTGLLPTTTTKRRDDEDDNVDDADNNDKGRPRKKSKKRRDTKFDLVLGEVAVSSSSSKRDVASADSFHETNPAREIGRVKFGKRSRPSCAVFLPDASGLVTGSSDGFVEIWDTHRWGKLRTHDLPYQKDENLMAHDDGAVVAAVAVSRDGDAIATVDNANVLRVWSVASGARVRELRCGGADAARVDVLAFDREGGRVLTGARNGSCREFGLRGRRLLREFAGHDGPIRDCAYDEDDDERVRVVTASADGTVRVWDGRSAECLFVIRPGTTTTAEEDGRLATTTEGASGGGRDVHTVLPLHTPERTLLVVPRDDRAYLVTRDGGVTIRTYRDDADSSASPFVAAAVSPSNKWLYVATESGDCVCFDVADGKVRSRIVDFMRGGGEGQDAKNGENDDKTPAAAEVVCVLHHPHTGVLASFDNDTSSRGLVRIWK